LTKTGVRHRFLEHEQRVLSREDIGALLDSALPTYRPILATAVCSGLRLMEVLGLTWADVDFDAGQLHVRKALGRDGERRRAEDGASGSFGRDDARATANSGEGIASLVAASAHSWPI
jgi:integrase